MEVLYDGFGDSKYRPCPLLKQYVTAGRMGRKSGRGFFMSINTELVSVEISDNSITVLKFNNPKSLNALSVEVLRKLLSNS